MQSLHPARDMELISTFDINKEALLDLLRGIQQGKIQLPDFQRDFVWNDQRISRLLCSISLAYPVGAITTLQLGQTHLRFKPRLLEGIATEPEITPTFLILDGQQRLTSLFQALFSSQPVTIRTKTGQKVQRRWYYIDIQKALQFPQIDRAEAILSISESLTLREHLRKLEEMGMSPARLDEILRSHLIDPDCLRKDDFEGFFHLRQQALMGMVSQAMGKSL
jgi:uncharacterized protein with ParB-like and HNH nuclease domain